jgi:hypothetical protein
MNDLISRKALIEECEKKRIVVHTTDDPFEVIREQGRIFRKAVDEAPTVDAMEVIRCKDCKHWKFNSCYRVHNQNAYLGHNNNAPILHDFKPEDFCSYGERNAR